MAKFKTNILWLLAGALVGASGMDLYWGYALSLVCNGALKASNNVLVPLVHGGPSESGAVSFLLGLTEARSLVCKFLRLDSPVRTDQTSRVRLKGCSTQRLRKTTEQN